MNLAKMNKASSAWRQLYTKYSIGENEQVESRSVGIHRRDDGSNYRINPETGEEQNLSDSAAQRLREYYGEEEEEEEDSKGKNDRKITKTRAIPKRKKVSASTEGIEAELEDILSRMEEEVELPNGKTSTKGLTFPVSKFFSPTLFFFSVHMILFADSLFDKLLFNTVSSNFFFLVFFFSSKAVAEQCCETIHAMTEDDNNDIIGESGAIPQLCLMIATHGESNANVAFHTCGALRNLAWEKHEENQRIIEENNGLRLIVEMMVKRNFFFKNLIIFQYLFTISIITSFLTILLTYNFWFIKSFI